VKTPGVSEAMCQALERWLKFDGNVEPPADDAPYEDHVAYETAKADVTEAAAEAVALWRQ
jgi:hypothetical protein